MDENRIDIRVEFYSKAHRKGCYSAVYRALNIYDVNEDTVATKEYKTVMWYTIDAYYSVKKDIKKDLKRLKKMDIIKNWTT